MSRRTRIDDAVWIMHMLGNPAQAPRGCNWTHRSKPLCRGFRSKPFLSSSKKHLARTGWQRRLRVVLVRATQRAEVDVIGAQLCSFARAIFSCVTLSWSHCSLPLIIVDNSPNMYNTCFFPDCLLLSVTDGSIWIPYFARARLGYSDMIFKKPNFEVVKWKSTFI